MAQISYTLYASIAESYAAIWEALDGVELDALAAVHSIVDVTTGTYGYTPATTPWTVTGAGTTEGKAAALELELALLDVFNAAYISVTGISSSSSSLLDAVRAINNHVINNYPSSTDAANGYGGTRATTPDSKLADFVNYLCIAPAPGSWECVPRGWAELTKDAGYAVDDESGADAAWYWTACLS